MYSTEYQGDWGGGTFYRGEGELEKRGFAAPKAPQKNLNTFWKIFGKIAHENKSKLP